MILWTSLAGSMKSKEIGLETASVFKDPEQPEQIPELVNFKNTRLSPCDGKRQLTDLWRAANDPKCYHWKLNSFKTTC